MKRRLVPIVLFTYNRPVITDQAVRALAANFLADQSELYIFSDGPRNEADQVLVKKVRRILGKIEGFAKIQIVKNEENKGLAESIIYGVTEILRNHESIIVLEDDLITSPAFLSFMNSMLQTYNEMERIYAVTGFNFPRQIMDIYQEYPFDIYLSVRPSSWGWGTWKNRWEKSDWDKNVYELLRKNRKLTKQFNEGGDDLIRHLRLNYKGLIDSWAILWCYTLFRNNGLCVYPTMSYVQNIGIGSFATHTTGKDIYRHNTLNLKTEKYKLPIKLEIDPMIKEEFKNIYHKKVVYRVYEWIKEINRK